MEFFVRRMPGNKYFTPGKTGIYVIFLYLVSPDNKVIRPVFIDLIISSGKAVEEYERGFLDLLEYLYRQIFKKGSVVRHYQSGGIVGYIKIFEVLPEVLYFFKMMVKKKNDIVWIRGKDSDPRLRPGI